MSAWLYCPNKKCNAPLFSQDAPQYAIPGDKCGWCGTPILVMPPEKGGER